MCVNATGAECTSRGPKRSPRTYLVIRGLRPSKCVVFKIDAIAPHWIPKTSKLA